MEPRLNPSCDDKKNSTKERLDKLVEDINKLPPDRIKNLEKIVHSMSKQVIGLREAARIFGVHPDTLRRAIKAGSMRAFQINKAGNWKVPIDEVERFIKGNSPGRENHDKD